MDKGRNKRDYVNKKYVAEYTFTSLIAKNRVSIACCRDDVNLKANSEVSIRQKTRGFFHRLLDGGKK